MSEALKAAVAVVDDNAGTRYATMRILKAAGFEVVELANGSEALARIDDKIDLVVLDVNMPDIDGFEVCRRLRKAPATQHIPVIHLSATFLDQKDLVHGLNAGADGYLTHPVEPQVLVATVGALLRARNADLARRAADAKLRAVFALAPVGVAMLDAGLVFRDANAAFCELVGMPHERLVGSRHDAVVAPLHDVAFTPLREATAAGSRWSGILPLGRQGGAAREVEWTVVYEPVNAQYILAAADVTERLRYDQDRERLLASERSARSDAQHATRLKDEFLATVSHELRNPLSSILGWTEVLLRSRGGNEPGLQAIQRSARLQKQLVDDLLDISAMMAGKVHLELGAVDPHNVIEGALDVVRAGAKAAGVSFEFTPAPQPVFVHADALRLQQVFWNLLSNAVKFTPPGGMVRVGIEQRGGQVLIAVRDNGKGIEPEFLPYIFDRFRQAEAGSTRRVTGLGLGLAIVRQLVELHGGTIEAASEGAGKGSTFTLRLPAAGSQQAAAPAELALPELAGRKALVVDDDADHRGWLVRLLADAGMSAQEAPGADAALECIARAVPDVLVSDIGMPGKDGYGLIRELRTRFTAEQLPAIALTAFSREADREAALAAGYQSYLVKPVTPSRILDALAALLAPPQQAAG